MTCIQYTPKHLWKNHLFKHQVCMFLWYHRRSFLLFFGGSTVLGINFSIPEALQLGHALGAESAGVSGRRGVCLTKNFWVEVGCYLPKNYQKTKTREIIFFVGKNWMV